MGVMISAIIVCVALIAATAFFVLRMRKRKADACEKPLLSRKPSTSAPSSAGSSLSLVESEKAVPPPGEEDKNAHTERKVQSSVQSSSSEASSAPPPAPALPPVIVPTRELKRQEASEPPQKPEWPSLQPVAVAAPPELERSSGGGSPPPPPPPPAPQRIAVAQSPSARRTVDVVPKATTAPTQDEDAMQVNVMPGRQFDRPQAQAGMQVTRHEARTVAPAWVPIALDKPAEPEPQPRRPFVVQAPSAAWGETERIERGPVERPRSAGRTPPGAGPINLMQQGGRTTTWMDGGQRTMLDRIAATEAEAEAREAERARKEINSLRRVNSFSRLHDAGAGSGRTPPDLSTPEGRAAFAQVPSMPDQFGGRRGPDRPARRLSGGWAG
jgi:hypothetical protein